MKLFVIVMFCVFGLNAAMSSIKLYRVSWEDRKTEFLTLIISVGFLVWTSVLLFG